MTRLGAIDYASARSADAPAPLRAPTSLGRQNRMLLLALLIGVACRLAQYLANMSFWTDEAALVLNIREKTAAQLLGTLDYAQAAPPLFLLADRAVFRAFGGGELALRLLPLCCGVGALLLFASVARRILAPPWDALAVLVFALSDRLTAHGAEVKPYIADVFFCALFLFIAVEAVGRRSAVWRLAWLCLAASVAVWFSFPSVLIFGALSLALLPDVWARSRAGLTRYILLNLPVVVSFAGLLLLTRATQKNAILTDYWKDAFIDWKHPANLPFWLAKRLLALCDYANPAAGPAILLAMVVGAVSLARQGKLRMLAMLLGPIAMALAPAALHRYPFDGARLTVFLTPCVLLLAACGFQALVADRVGGIRVVGVMAVGYAISLGVYWCGLHLVSPRNRGHLRPVAAFMHDRARDGETIYCFDAQPFRCYWRSDDPRLRDQLDRADKIPTDRFWIVWSFGSKHGEEKAAPALNWAREFCREEASYHGRGGAAVLFERIPGRLPAANDPPYDGLDVARGRKRAVDLIEGR